MVKFADDTVVVGQISHNDESSYRQEVTELVDWCGENSLCINVGKTKELIVDFRTKQHVPPLPLFINGAVVERVPSFKYLGVHISEDLKWAINTSNILKKAHQRLYFLRRLRQAGLSTSVLEAFYRCVVESTLTFSITTWYGNCTAANKKALQRVVKNAQKITQSSLPSIETIYTSRCRSTAARIMEDYAAQFLIHCILGFLCFLYLIVLLDTAGPEYDFRFFHVQTCVKMTNKVNLGLVAVYMV